MPLSETIELQEVAAKTRYPLDAFLFIQRGLDFTVRRLHGELDPLEEDESEDQDADADTASSRHVSGQDLCCGLRDFAIKEYGMLARTVLRRWNITSCRDFGQVVFAMVDGGLMRKTNEDSIHDFNHVFDFSTAFTPELMLND